MLWQRPARTLLQQGPSACHEEWHLAGTAAGRTECLQGREKAKIAHGISWGAWEGGSALNSKNDHGGSSSLQGKGMSCPDSELDTPREHPAVRKADMRLRSPEERRGVLREPPRGTVETRNGPPYGSFPL